MVLSRLRFSVAAVVVAGGAGGGNPVAPEEAPLRDVRDVEALPRRKACEALEANKPVSENFVDARLFATELCGTLVDPVASFMLFIEFVDFKPGAPSEKDARSLLVRAPDDPVPFEAWIFTKSGSDELDTISRSNIHISKDTYKYRKKVLTSIQSSQWALN